MNLWVTSSSLLGSAKTTFVLSKRVMLSSIAHHYSASGKPGSCSLQSLAWDKNTNLLYRVVEGITERMYVKGFGKCCTGKVLCVFITLLLLLAEGSPNWMGRRWTLEGHQT